MPSTCGPVGLSAASQARAALAVRMARADLLRALEGLSGPDPGTLAGLEDLLERQRRVAALTIRLRVMTVVACREAGMCWVGVGVRAGMEPDVAERVYGEALARWREGDAAPWTPRLPGVLVGYGGPPDRSVTGGEP